MTEEITKKVDEFFSQYRPRTYEKGQILIYAEDAPPAIFQLIEGSVRVYDISYRGDEVVLNVFKPPAFFPMMYAMMDEPNHFFYAASTKITVREAPLDAAVKFIKDNPDVMYDLLMRVYIGTEGMMRRMAYLMASNAKNIVMYGLLIEARRFGTKQADGSCIILLSETELANRVGLSRESVSRQVKKLKNAELLENEHGSIIIKDLVALERALGSSL